MSAPLSREELAKMREAQWRNIAQRALEAIEWAFEAMDRGDGVLEFTGDIDDAMRFLATRSALRALLATVDAQAEAARPAVGEEEIARAIATAYDAPGQRDDPPGHWTLIAARTVLALLASTEDRRE
jgi:hypothetical protein